ncbi:cupin domain-containing protein [Cellulomonas fengjieae]|uniref:Cupin domain-containing protein n=1 Tax=Cellulomonas fengjieae TaxID=2819978 RepID=A0ABS3SE08_9CELL|nr:cupin domain-containing protein [Cellulomonas fengjieae]MBO3083195.1 cupin domain-containing protein [Cellulomonas fengjieae]QVI65448.1 cupin domain-containing protein [Cellulomonas fengjieae]
MSALPGGVSVSHLRVYDWPAPDGVGRAGSGSPHLHVASSEAYVVLGGSGSVHTIGPAGFSVHPLTPGTIVSFGPGVVHRAVNDGDLEVLVLMSNAGLPEAGDAVLTFPSAVLADPAAYREAATLPTPASGASDDEIAAAARRRRDLALEGYAELGAAVDRLGPAALRPWHDAAARLVRMLVPHWQDVWTRSVYAQTQATASALEGLIRGVAPHLAGGSVTATAAAAPPRRYGMCGRLQTWPTSP